MTMGCHSSCGVFFLSSLDTMLAPQKQEQGSAVTETAERWKNRWRARTGEEREEIEVVLVGSLPLIQHCGKQQAHYNTTPKTPSFKMQPGEELTSGCLLLQYTSKA